MHKHILKTTALAVLVLNCVSAFAAPQTLSYDFSYGIPEDMTLYDRDGLTPSTDLNYAGFEVGKPWVAYDVERTNGGL